MPPEREAAERARAGAAAAAYLSSAVAAVDAEFGAGAAAERPELLAALVQAAAIERAIETGRVSAREMRDAVVSLKPRLF